ncbi:Hypothetical protein ETEE_0690 [Edwardsiella anguillarum ET080813]|uniref:Uncharacterized protein n=1 Tax=Edwardsiella anguillarum ET080813 TaxID=667120 RepID=A0A076LGB0_9GAMM|nr:Hypothetical protein ETEE_0690 [Edwardsiella anguillarum ET080813]
MSIELQPGRKGKKKPDSSLNQVANFGQHQGKRRNQADTFRVI